MSSRKRRASTSTDSQTPATRSLASAGPISKAVTLPKRPVTSIACDRCRERRVKCDGQRPQCGRCATEQRDCTFSVDASYNSRFQALKLTNDRLNHENRINSELLRLLRTKPPAEAMEIYRRLRIDPVANLEGLLTDIKAAEVMLASPSLQNSASVESSIRELEVKAIESSLLKVPSRPWTTVATDGVVSELISSFFMWDYPFYMWFMDQDAFLQDMRSQDIKSSKYCSPFLVNAICAVRCATSTRIRKLSALLQYDLGVKFMSEAKRLLNEEVGRASLPTVQGLALLYIATAFSGQDRAGLLYRYSAFTMLKSLRLERQVQRLEASSAWREARILRRAIWGFFCFESIIAWVYLQPSLVSPPTIERLREPRTGSMIVDIFNNEFTETSPQPPMIPSTYEAVCDVCLVLWDVMAENADAEPITDLAIERRQGYLAAINEINKRLPEELIETGVAPTHQQCYLSVLMDCIIISAIRPLNSTLHLHYTNCTVKELVLKVCDHTATIVRKFLTYYKPLDYSCMLVCGAYNIALVLIPYLSDPRSHSAFAHACYILHFVSPSYPMIGFIFKGLEAMAWSLKVEIPANAIEYFQAGTAGKLGKDLLMDVPMSFSIPLDEDVRQSLFSEQQEADPGISTELGLLLSKWSRLSI